MSRVPADPQLPALALDLGSTRIKAAVLDARGRLDSPVSLPAPPLRATDDERREGDALAYVEAAEGLLEILAARVPRDTPLGIASQRSSFLLWDARDGRPRTPLFSWQDRRGAAWCAARPELAEIVLRATGLVLSGHYVGPKLAVLAESGIDLADPDLRCGTLCSYLSWRLSGGERHEIDLTMAARTAMLDLGTGDWSGSLLAAFGVPRALLPVVRPSRRGEPIETHGLKIAVTLADQAAGALAVLEERGDAAVINVGTGSFVMRGLRTLSERRSGYLVAPIWADRGVTRLVLEAPVNAGAVSLVGLGAGPSPLPSTDPAPDAFCIPDAAGLAAPHWRPDSGLRFSAAAARLGTRERRRVVLEGLLFRIREVLDGLDARTGPLRLSGGLGRESFVGAGLAALLERPVDCLRDAEAGLIGTARAAAGLAAFHEPAVRRVRPGRAGGYLPEKYDRWRVWLTEQLGR